MRDGIRHLAFGIRAALLLPFLFAPFVGAQLLDLDPPEPIAAGEGAAGNALIDDLDAQIRSLVDAPDDGAVRAQIVVRELARMLIRTGVALGEPGSNRVVIGATLTRGLGDIDAAITHDRLNDTDRARLLEELELLASSPPDDLDDLDRALRDAFAILLVDRPVSGGWVRFTLDAGRTAPRIDTWVEEGWLAPETAEALTEFDALLDLAAAEPGYARTAAWLRDRINQAARAIGETPEWLPDDATAALIRSFNESVAALCADSTDDDAAETLSGIAYLVNACRRVKMIDDDRVADAVRSAIADAAEDPGAARDRYAPADNLIAALDTFDRPIPQPKVRPLRSAGKAMMSRTRRLRTDLESAIADALADGTRSDPAALSLIARGNDYSRDVNAINTLDRLLAPVGDGRDEWRRAVAKHLLDITRLFADDETEAEAFERLRALAAYTKNADRLRRFAGSGQRESNAETYDALLDGRRTQFAAMLSRTTERAEAALADTNRPIPDSVVDDDLRMLIRQLDLIDDLVDARSFAEQYALGCLPAWGLSRDDLLQLLEPIELEVIELNAALLDGRDQQRAMLLPQAERHAALLRLTVRLEFVARSKYDGTINANSVFARAALGAPLPGSWMATHRDQLATISRYATELAHAQRDGDDNTVNTLDEFVRAEATRLLNTLD